MPDRHQLIVVILIFISNKIFNNAFGNAKVLLKSVNICDPKANYSATCNTTITTVDNVQYFDGLLVLTAALDNSLKANVTVEVLVGKHYLYLFSITERKSCNSLNKYFGELWYDIERHAGLIPGLCPVPVGRYFVHHYLLDFEKMPTLHNFPFGTLRFTDVAYDSNNNVYTCMVVEVENYP